MLRSYLFEAAGVLLTRVPKVCRETLGVKLVMRNELPQGQVAVARNLAVICIAFGPTEPSLAG